MAKKEAKKNDVAAEEAKVEKKAAETKAKFKKEKLDLSEVGQSSNTTDIVKIISELSTETDRKITQTDAAHVVRLMHQAIAQELSKGKRVQIAGLVTFYPSYRGARKGNNVFTGEIMDIPEGVALMSKASGSLKSVMKEMDSKIVKAIKDLSEAN